MAHIRDWPWKVISDPIHGIIDVSRWQPILNVPEFQSLSDKKQLGMVYLVFPSALHSRMAHSLGAGHSTADLGDRWVKRGYITQRERDAMVMFAYWHDIEHLAFSHVTEDFCTDGHDARGCELIKKYGDVIGACDVDHGLVVSLASHDNPLYKGVHDKNVGMEKLDYLERDGHYTIRSRPSGVDYLRHYLHFIDGEVAIDEKVVEHALDVQTFYMKMFKGVYFRKSVVIAERTFQKMVYHLIRSGELTLDDLTRMTDSELIGTAYFSKDPTVKKLYGYIRERSLFREAVTIRPKDFAHETRVAGKPIAALGIPLEDMKRLVTTPALQKSNHEEMEKLEERIADLVGIPHGSVLVVPVFNPERFEVKDIKILKSNGELGSLKEDRPGQLESLEEIARSYFALRICTRDKYRIQMSEPGTAQKVLELVMSAAS